MKSIALIISILLSINILAQKVDTDAVYEKITTEYTLNTDGSVVYHYYKKLKLNTHFSFNRLYGETFIVYNPAYQSLTINNSQTTQENGEVVEGPVNSFNEVLPRFASNAPYFNGLREMVVTHPGLEVGAVIELDYTITSKAGFYPGLMADEVLTRSSPVTEHEVIIRIPTSKTLHYKVLNLRTGPEIKESKSETTYSFTFNGLKENTHETFQPSDQLHQPRIFFSTLTFEEAIASITDQHAFTYKVDEPMKKFVNDLKEKNKDDVLLALALQKMVSSDINTYGIPPYYIGYTMRTAIETWKGNGGTPCEKTILLASLLREAGINANPVMIIPSKLYNEEIGCLPLAETIYLQVNPRDTEQMYLSAFMAPDQNLVFSMNDKTLLLFDPGKHYVESISESFENKVIMNGNFVVSDDFKFAGKMEISLTERANPYYKFMNDSSFVTSLIGGGISKKDIISSDIVNSAQFRTLAKLTIETKEPVKNQSDYYFWEIPLNKNGTESWRIKSLNNERYSPLEVPFVVNEQYSYTITLPEHIQLANPVELTERQSDFGKLVLSANQNGKEVLVKRLLVIDKPIISTTHYQAFKEMMDLWNEKNFRKLVLKKVVKQ